MSFRIAIRLEQRSGTYVCRPLLCHMSPAHGTLQSSQLVSYDYFKALYSAPPPELSFLYIDKPVLLHIISSISSSAITTSKCGHPLMSCTDL